MNKDNIIKTISILFFLFFLFTYIVGSSGFYEYKLNEKKVLTEEMIKKFELDVSKGIDIDITNYVQDNFNDYDNLFTKINRDISYYINKGFEITFEYLFKYINEE